MISFLNVEMEPVTASMGWIVCIRQCDSRCTGRCVNRHQSTRCNVRASRSARPPDSPKRLRTRLLHDPV